MLNSSSPQEDGGVSLHDPRLGIGRSNGRQRVFQLHAEKVSLHKKNRTLRSIGVYNEKAFYCVIQGVSLCATWHNV